MSTIGGANIVRDGLVMNLDAANKKSYVSGSTIWTDISTNGNNGTLINGPTFNSDNLGSIVFDGIDDYGEIANNINLNNSSGSVNVWFKHSSAPGNGSVIIGKTVSGGSFNGYNIFVFSTFLGCQLKSGGSTTNINPISVSINTWYNCCLTYISGNTYSFYVNGNLVDSAPVVSFSISTQPLRLAKSIDAFWSNFVGSIGNTHIYNRALSSQEVLQNYEALKSRYIY